MRRLFFLGVVLAVAGVPAAVAEPDTHFYARGDLGVLVVENDSCDSSTIVTCDEGAGAVRVGGGAQVAENLAVEVGFTQSAAFDVFVRNDLVGSVRYRGLDTHLFGTFDVGNGVRLFGGGGVVLWSQEDDTNGRVSFLDDDGTDFSLAGGGDLDVNDRLRLSLFLNRVFLSNGSAGLFALGGAYRF